MIEDFLQRGAPLPKGLGVASEEVQMRIGSGIRSLICYGIVALSLSQVALADGPGMPDGSVVDGDSKASMKSDKDASTHATAPRVARLETAQNEDLAAAVGHYARTRSLLIAALNEFDAGMKLANPDSLLDSKRFRSGIIDRAEELERVLDPQPRATKGGVKYNADPRLLGRK